MRALPAAGVFRADAEFFDCWNRIGVRGDKSCPELDRHSHCRNCPAYSAAAAVLLDRELPECAEEGSFLPSEHEEARGKLGGQSAVVFRVGGEWFALSTVVLDEIVAMRAIHSLPHRRNPALLGLVNVRGELVVCVSIARLLVGDAAAQLQGRLVVLRHGAGRLAFPVDEVQHAQRYRPGELKPVPATVARSGSSFTRGLLTWRDRTVGYLDERLVLDALERSLA
jgi:chemotaxis signal transduction protein